MTDVVTFAVVDLETTGLAPPSSIIELGVTLLAFNPEMKTTQIMLPRNFLYAPVEEMTPENIAIHHITPKMLEGKPHCSEEDLRNYVSWSDPRFLVAAWADFEQQWITPAVLAPLGPPAPRWICTVKAAARLFPDAESHSTQAMRYRLGLDLDEALAMPPHRAGPDSYVTAYILAAFLQMATVRDLVQWTMEPRFLPRVPFGKYKGAAWADVPADYLRWCEKQSDMDADVRHAVRLELERRG